MPPLLPPPHSARSHPHPASGTAPGALIICLALFPFHAGAAPPAAAERVPPTEIAGRRAAVIAALEKAGEGAFLLLRAPPEREFAEDVSYPYRPENDVYYLTGLSEPGCALLLASKAIGERGKTVLFVELPHPALKVWVGEGLTREAAAEASGIALEAVLDRKTLPAVLREAAPGRRRHAPAPWKEPPIYFDEGRGFGPDEPPSEPHLFLMASLGSSAFHVRLRAPAELIHPLRQVKSPAEIRLIETAIRATEKAIRAACREIRPGAHEYGVRAAVEGTFIREGCAGWSFPPIIASGPNSCVLHYPGYGRRIEDGDLVLLDIGAEKGFYAADVTRTVPANGKFTKRQKEVYEAVLRAQETAIRAIRPGVPFAEVNAVARREVAKALPGLGLEAEGENPGRYLQHGTSHGLGLAVHDPMPAGTLAAGMVITVEPGIYIPEEALGVRIEDDVLVTEDGARVLSDGAPKTVEGIEAWMREREF